MAPSTRHLSIPLESGDAVSAVLTAPSAGVTHVPMGVVIAHGAGNDMHHPLITFLADGLAADGFATLRFNFPYREKGKKAPDPQNKLIHTWKNVFEFFRSRCGLTMARITAAGKSMGGRVASQMAAEGLLPVDRLVFLGYPLHAPGRKAKLRDAHLYRIRVPMLFFAGTRDTLCDLELLRGVLERIDTPWELEVIDGGNHSFELPKSARGDPAELNARIRQRTSGWLSSPPGS
jgi:predicted alpha/beta-hydrolase family hydrolase